MTVNELITLSSDDISNFEIHVGNFLDEFYRRDKKEKAAMVAKPPNKKLPAKQMAFLAATVEKLCNDSGISPPKWVFEKQYFLEEPYFALDAQGMLRVILLLESPNEFLVRNIFISNNALSRV